MHKHLIFLFISILSLAAKGQNPSSLFDNTKNSLTYVVNKNDKSLWSICKRFNISLEIIQSENKLKTAIIKEGDTLNIPIHLVKKNTKELIIHEVKKEDISLWNISKQYLVEVDDIIRINQKQNNKINIGEILIIPSLNCRLQKFEIIHIGHIFSKIHLHIITKRMIDKYSMEQIPTFEIFTLKENRYEKILEIDCDTEKNFKLADFNKDGFKDIRVKESQYSEDKKCSIYLYQPNKNNFCKPTFIK